MCTRCDFTVASDSMSCWPISRLEEPPATSWSTSSSRGVSEERGLRSRVCRRLRTIGDGFDVDALPGKPVGLGHLGLDAMRTRAAELGGELVVESAPGGPTAVSVAVPVDEAAEDSVDGGGDSAGRINRKIEEEE